MGIGPCTGAKIGVITGLADDGAATGQSALANLQSAVCGEACDIIATSNRQLSKRRRSRRFMSPSPFLRHATSAIYTRSVTWYLPSLPRPSRPLEITCRLRGPLKISKSLVRQPCDDLMVWRTMNNTTLNHARAAANPELRSSDCSITAENQNQRHVHDILRPCYDRRRRPIRNSNRRRECRKHWRLLVLRPLQAI